MWLAWPDEARKKNLFAIETPGVGSFIATGSWTAAVPGLSDFPEDDSPPVIPFFGFGSWWAWGWPASLSLGRQRAALAGPARDLLLVPVADVPRLSSGFVAIIAGWYTAEVGRQPWVVYGLLRTADAHTPTLTTSDVLTSLIGYVVVYAVIYSFGLYYIYHLLRDGPTDQAHEITRATPCVRWPPGWPKPRPARPDRPGGDAMDASWLAVFWAALIAFAILVYVLLDGFDLGIGVLFGTTRDQNYRGQMLSAIAPFWDGNETWLVIIGPVCSAPFRWSTRSSCRPLPSRCAVAARADLRGVAFEFRYRTERMRWLWDWGFFLGALIAGFVQGAAIGTMVRSCRSLTAGLPGRRSCG